MKKCILLIFSQSRSKIPLVSSVTKFRTELKLSCNRRNMPWKTVGMKKKKLEKYLPRRLPALQQKCAPSPVGCLSNYRTIVS